MLKYQKSLREKLQCNQIKKLFPNYVKFWGRIKDCLACDWTINCHILSPSLMHTAGLIMASHYSKPIASKSLKPCFILHLLSSQSFLIHKMSLPFHWEKLRLLSTVESKEM
jgi:hypothetical protein